jgi:hypothetical protein
MAGLPRPDRAHYVIDLEYDYITMQEPNGGPAHQVQVLQVWVDPAFREAHRTPDLRAHMLRLAENYRIATIVRWSSRDALVIFPPPFSSDRQWTEVANAVIRARTKEERAILNNWEVTVGLEP